MAKEVSQKYGRGGHHADRRRNNSRGMHVLSRENDDDDRYGSGSGRMHRHENGGGRGNQERVVREIPKQKMYGWDEDDYNTAN